MTLNHFDLKSRVQESSQFIIPGCTWVRKRKRPVMTDTLKWFCKGFSIANVWCSGERHQESTGSTGSLHITSTFLIRWNAWYACWTGKTHGSCMVAATQLHVAIRAWARTIKRGSTPQHQKLQYKESEDLRCHWAQKQSLTPGAHL